jgi:hypothetical protein
MSESSFSHGRGGILAGLSVALYAWLAACSFGIVFLDGIYARSIDRADAAENLASVQNEIGDLLQLPLALMVLAGVLALTAVWQRRRARCLVLASLALTLAPLPAVWIFGTWIEGTGAGPLIRLGFGGLASVFAMAAAMSYFESGGGPSPEPIPS